jgi:hypothetical protein
VISREYHMPYFYYEIFIMRFRNEFDLDLKWEQRKFKNEKKENQRIES